MVRVFINIFFIILFLPIFWWWRMQFVGRFFAGIEYLKKSTGFLISGWFDLYER